MSISPNPERSKIPSTQILDDIAIFNNKLTNIKARLADFNISFHGSSGDEEKGSVNQEGVTTWVEKLRMAMDDMNYNIKRIEQQLTDLESFMKE